MTKNHKYVFGFLFVGFVALMAFYSYENPVVEEATAMESDQFIVPLKVHIVIDELNYYTSNRDEENILELFEQTNRIWKQADIKFEIEELVFTELSENAIPNAINIRTGELYNHENFDKERINVFFTKSLNGINGLALSNINSAFVADFTTVNDYRTNAHEFGHLLGLRHVDPFDRLMARGKNGEILSESEIIIARENVRRFV